MVRAELLYLQLLANESQLIQVLYCDINKRIRNTTHIRNKKVENCVRVYKYNYLLVHHVVLSYSEFEKIVLCL